MRFKIIIFKWNETKLYQWRWIQRNPTEIHGHRFCWITRSTRCVWNARTFFAYDHNDNHENFIQYFENTWVGRPRRRARFDPTMWNARTVTEIDLPRTTNNVESWHLAFQKSLSCHHPTIYKLAEQLIKENVRVNAIAIKLFNGEEFPLYSNPHYRDANVLLLNLIGR